MSNPSHTPGPWEIVEHMGHDFLGNNETGDEDDKMGIRGPAGQRVLWFGNSETYYPTEGEEPNQYDARLIAAAPDLLELVKLVHGSFGGGRIITFSDAAIAEFEAAISKVEGTS